MVKRSALLVVGLCACNNYSDLLETCRETGACVTDSGSGAAGGGATGTGGGTTAAGGGMAGAGGGDGGGSSGGGSTAGGTGTDFTVEPTLLSFSAFVGSSETKQVSVRNGDAGTVTGIVGSITIGGPTFTVNDQGCAAGLGPSDSCLIDVTFNADNTATVDGTLRVGAMGVLRDVTLAGTRMQSMVTGTCAAFADTQLGQSGMAQCTLSTSSAAPISNLNVSVVNAGGGVFSFPANSCGTTLSPGAPCTFNVGFAPDHEGVNRADLVVRSSSVVVYQLPLSGVGFSVLTVSTAGLGRGTVTGSDGGFLTALSCPPTCAPRVRRDLPTLLRGQPGSRSRFDTWTGACTPGSANPCTLVEDAGLTVVASFAPRHNYMFYTANGYGGNLGGLDGGDTRCRDVARDAGFPGRFIAVLAAGNQTIQARIGGARGFFRPLDDQPIFESPVTARSILYPILDENGGYVGAGMFTGSEIDGGVAANTCGGWTQTDAGVTGAAGNTLYQVPSHLNHFNLSCADLSSYKLLCAGTTENESVTDLAIPDGGRRFFITDNQYNVASFGGAGAPNASIHCQNEATDAGLSGDFVAFLAADAAAPIARVNLDGGSWYRVNGVPFISPAQLATPGSFPIHSPHLTVKYRRVLPNSMSPDIWTGATSPLAAGQNCTNWTGSGTAYYGQAGFTQNWFSSMSTGTACSTPSRTGYLYCFEK